MMTEDEEVPTRPRQAPDPIDGNLLSVNAIDEGPSGLDLRKANLFRADLRGVDLSCANLREANLAGANLRGVNLAGADLSWANLCGADLSGANLTAASLYWAFLRGIAPTEHGDASPDEERFCEGANLTGTCLDGANLRYAVVTPEQLAQARSLAGAIMPDGTRHA